MEEEHAAARRIQAAYKGYAIRRAMDGMNLTPSTRWKELLDLVLLENTQQSKDTSRWSKSRILLSQLNRGNPPGDAHSKMMETQHWLEMIDRKHRVGTNLHYYHTFWNTQDTKENFFYWLDEGSGKHVSLPACPRSLLNKERVKYLSVKERKHYMADIRDGKMVWVESREPIDTFGTDAKQHLDRDVVNSEDGNLEAEPVSSDDDQATKFTKSEQLKKLTHLSLSHMMEKIMKATSKSYRWMFVTDSNFNFYLAPKTAGVFQHSSFLGGARVTSAGLIKIRQGKIIALSPLSGHYRCTSEHFAQVLRHLECKGIDIHNVHISKSLAVLWTLESWNEVKQVLHRSK